MKYCPKCGKAISDEFDFCMNCGARIDHNPTAYADTHVQVKKSKRQVAIFSSIVLIIIIVLSAFFITRKYSLPDTLSGRYNSFGGHTVYTFIPDSQNENIGTYEEELDPDNPITLTGKWGVADGQVTLVDDLIAELYTSAGMDFTEHYGGTTYQITDNYHYLIDLESAFNETVPTEKQFEATFTRIDSLGGDVKYAFHMDGTFEHTQSLMTPANGKYTRDGSLITMESNSGYMYRFFVYNGKLYADGYYKVKE